MNAPDRWDELGSFLGASYFRLLGKGQRYGQSARGLALNSGETDVPEEFPLFTDWWLEKPEKQSDVLRLYGLLDSVSCSGAYEFLIRPGETTVVDINAVVYFREEKNIRMVSPNQKPLKTFGIAPLTSMFWFGENSEKKPDDYRPEVHDSDGLFMRLEDGRLLWQPLNNPSSMQHQSFAANNVRGFGLFQRDRDFANYQDTFNSYHKVPGVWVEPRGKWGEGQVHLLELSTHYEGLDNIVAFWNPRKMPDPMLPYSFGYTLHWAMEPDANVSTNRVLQTRIGADPRDGSQRQFVIDFDAKSNGISAEEAPQAQVRCGDNAVISEVQVFKNEVSKSWRVIFRLKPKAVNEDSIDIECALTKNAKVFSETWLYHWNPNSAKKKTE